MNAVRLLTRWIFIVSIPILLLSGTIAWAFNSLWIYKGGFTKYDVGQALGLSSNELDTSASELIAYFNDPHQQYLDINVTYNNGVTAPLYDQADILHMKAVKDLIWVDYGLLIFAAIYSLVYILANAIWSKRDGRRDIGLGTAWDNQPNIDSIRGNCWLAVDLGAKYTIDSVAIYWEHSGSGKFAIQVPKSDALPLDSSDAGWTTLVIDTTLKFQPVPVDMGITQLKLPAPTTTRYVRVHSYKRLAGDEFAYGISIEEFEVYGVPATSIKPATQIRTTSSDLTLTTTKTGVSIKANDYNQRTTTADIFAPNGQLVRHLSGTESSFWNYKDNFGSKVTNGTYMIRLTSAGKTYQDKITVNR